MTQQRITIRELARLSGVSVGTVSRALNGYPDVGAATRERVMRLAEELDYTPDAAARKLVTRRSHLVGVVLETGEGRPDLEHPFFHEVLAGLKRRLGEEGYDLLLFASERPGNGYGAHSYVKRSRHHGVDGVVMMGVDREDPDVDRMVHSSLPCVSVDIDLHGQHTSCVSSDNHQGARLAVEHLAELGHRRIAMIAGPPETMPGRERLRGFQRAIAALDLPYFDDLVAYGDYYYESGREAMERLLAARPRPTAVFAASDMMAIGAMRAVHAAGLSVPHDVAVVGFDDIAMAAMAHPALSTVRQEKTALGALAADTLLRNVAAAADGGGQGSPAAVTLPVSLVVRESSAAGAKNVRSE